MTQSDTLSITGRPGSGSPVAGLPKIAKTPRKMKNAIAMFTVGPPAITMTFFHHAIL